jgi:hypothetical protein
MQISGVYDFVRWMIPLLGVTGAAYGMCLVRRSTADACDRTVAAGFFVYPNSISAIIIFLSMAAVTVGGVPREYLPPALLGLASGWLLLFAVFGSSRMSGQRLAVDDSGTKRNPADTAFDLLSAPSFIATSAVLLGVGCLRLALLHAGRATESSEILILLALGFWTAATFWSIPSALYRGLLTREIDVQPNDIIPLCVRFRCASGEITFLAASAFVVCACMRIVHAEWSVNESIYPFGVLAGSLLLGILVNPLLHPGRPGARLLNIIGVAVFVLGSATISCYLAFRCPGGIRIFYCFGLGLLTALLVMLSARYRPPFTGLGSMFGTEIAVFEALILLVSEMLAFRWMAGYGVALCTAGLFASLPVLFPIGALWAIESTEKESDTIDLPFIAHAASRFAETVMAAGAFLVIVSILRLFYERVHLRGIGIDITNPYALMGLIIGGSFPTLISSAIRSEHTGKHISSLDSRTLPKLGRWAGFVTLCLWAIAIIIPVFVSYFGRKDSSVAFLVGLAAAELYLIFSLWLAEVKNAADEGMRYASRATHILAVGSALVATLIAPPLARIGDASTPIQRLHVLLGIAMVIVAFMVVAVRNRLKSERG